MTAAGFSIKLDTISSKFSVTNSHDAFSFLGNSSCDYIMGFTETVSSVDNLDGTYTLSLPRPCNFLPLPRVCLRCPQLSGDSNILGSFNSSDIVLTIPNSAKQNGQIVYENSAIKHMLKADRLDKLVFSFTDDDNEPINFNGFSCFFILQFDIYRRHLVKPPKFNEIRGLVL